MHNAHMAHIYTYSIFRFIETNMKPKFDKNSVENST